MAGSATTKTGHFSLDYPDIIGHSYASNNPTIAPIPVIFLTRLTSPRREELLQQLKQGDGNPWPEDVPKCALGAVPWLRSFEPSINDILHIASGTCITITDEHLQEGKCIISHIVFDENALETVDNHEFALASITEAYKLACSERRKKSWFPDTLSPDKRFVPIKDTEADPVPNSNHPYVELPVFVTVPLTSQQETYLYALLACESAEPEFFHVLGTSPDLDDLNYLMAYFKEKSWFPGDFVIIDSTTVSSVPVPIPTSSIPAPEAEFDPPYPSFLLCTELLMWHLASDGELVASDRVGYAVRRRTMEESEEYQMWSANAFRAMGLGSWIGWCYDGLEEDNSDQEEGIERYYWDCWLDARGRVDGEVRAKADVKD